MPVVLVPVVVVPVVSVVPVVPVVVPVVSVVVPVVPVVVPEASVVLVVLVPVVLPDVRIAIWQKFLFICAFSGVTALTRVPIGAILADPVTYDLFRGTLEEAEAVARASGIELPADCVEQALSIAAAVEPWGRGSMYHDLANGLRLELEALNGEVVRRGDEQVIQTPLNFAIYAALKPYINGEPLVP